MKSITVRYIKTDYVKKHLDSILPILDCERISKAKRYLNESDRLLSIGAGYLIAKYIGKNPIKTNENGKLYMNNAPLFNISHSGEYVVIAISEEREIGVDIQLINDKDLKPIEYVTKESYPLEEMFQIWSNKESLIKCLGKSMAIIKEVPGLPLSGTRVFNNEKYYTHSMAFEGYSLSITLKGEEPFEVELKEA